MLADVIRSKGGYGGTYIFSYIIPVDWYADSLIRGVSMAFFRLRKTKEKADPNCLTGIVEKIPPLPICRKRIGGTSLVGTGARPDALLLEVGDPRRAETRPRKVKVTVLYILGHNGEAGNKTYHPEVNLMSVINALWGAGSLVLIPPRLTRERQRPRRGWSCAGKYW